MHTTLITLLIIDSALLIIAVLLQPSKSAGLSGAIAGGAEQLFGKQKARGSELWLHRATIVLVALFFILAILLAYVVK